MAPTQDDGGASAGAVDPMPNDDVDPSAGMA
jgi:hypothetical protein